jgi:hypothetical protein
MYAGFGWLRTESYELGSETFLIYIRGEYIRSVSRRRGNVTDKMYFRYSLYFRFSIFVGFLCWHMLIFVVDF